MYNCEQHMKEGEREKEAAVKHSQSDLTTEFYLILILAAFNRITKYDNRIPNTKSVNTTTHLWT